jgi:phosphoribosyl-AMP cyclohydrolase
MPPNSLSGSQKKVDMTQTIPINYNEKGLVPAIAQDKTTKQVLMVAWMNEEAFERTLTTGQAHFWSRSRKKLWLKGETSGNILTVKDIMIDCDADTILLLVDPAGPACHTGNTSCFYRTIKKDPND